MVVYWSLVRRCESRILEAMSIDDQAAPSCASTQEIVAGIADDQPQVMSSGEVDTCFDVLMRLCKDHVDSIVSKCTSCITVGRRPAGLVGVVGPQGSRGLIDSSLLSVRGRNLVHSHLKPNSRPLCAIEVLLDIGACSRIICSDISEWSLQCIMADSPRGNMDGKVAIQGGVQSRPIFTSGPAFIARIALAIVGAPVPRGRYQCGRNPTKHDYCQYCQHYGKRQKL